jgi:CRP/FNR family transcriptional regulator, cyclic AMP receptor protein
LGEKEGRFHFVPGLSENEMALPELGMFMELLMEGLRKLDERQIA